ncbi:MAG TPA: C40 family peptidase [Burkholderiales bacterium]|nr:C40 family peptidase [Burkholderiales bacterium]
MALKTDRGTAILQAADRHLTLTRELVMQALGYLGIRYKYGGNSPETGFDCSGLVRYVVGEAFGLVLPRDARSISRHGASVSTDDLQPGDLVFFNTMRRPFSHVGIYVGDGRFIHAPASGGAVELVNMADRYWAARFNGARRLEQ